MSTYTTLSGDVIDLSGLTNDERKYLEYALSAWRSEFPYETFYFDLVGGADNPLVGASRLIRREIMGHPLWRALRDIEDRVGIDQGKLAPAPDDDVNSDPMQDERVSVTAAARKKAVTRTAIYKAIERGDLIATEGGVSGRSLAAWTVNGDRQRAGRIARSA